MPETSPADELRAAAKHMRDHHDSDHPRYRFWREIARWLNRVADAGQPPAHGSPREALEWDNAIHAARFYMEAKDA